MPRRRLRPRLYLDKKRRPWVVRDAEGLVRPGRAGKDIAGAESVLAAYIADKYQPRRSASPPVADILLAYLRDKIPHMRSRSSKYHVSNLARGGATRR